MILLTGDGKIKFIKLIRYWKKKILQFITGLENKHSRIRLVNKIILPNGKKARYIAEDSRKGVYNYVSNISKTTPFEEPIINIGAGDFHTFDELFKEKLYIRYDITACDGSIDIIGDAHEMGGIKDICIGLALCLQVLEHVENPSNVISSIERVLKKGGLLIISTPNEWSLHSVPKDYWRFTPYGVLLLLKRFEVLDLTITGNPFKPTQIYALARKIAE